MTAPVQLWLWFPNSFNFRKRPASKQGAFVLNTAVFMEHCGRAGCHQPEEPLVASRPSAELRLCDLRIRPFRLQKGKTLI